MKYLQETINQSNNKLKSRILKLIYFLNIVALFVTISLNFLGMPVLKYHYLVHVSLTLFAILLFDFIEVLPLILVLYFLEGQGRIIWEYASWARIIFDALVLLATLKIFVTKRRIIDSKRVPFPLVFLVAAHFTWYMVEFSNLNSLSYFAVLAATKVYIFPILFFFGLTQIDFHVDKKVFQRTLNLLVIIFLLELSLTFYQFQMKEQLIMQISPYYFKIMRYGVFVGKFYRPFSTTQGPGTISIFIFLTIGLLYLKNSSKINTVLWTLLVFGSGYIIILCQIRSAFIKFVLIILALHLGELLFFRFKAKSFAALVIVLSFLVIGTPFLYENNSRTKDEGINYARDRLLSLENLDQVKSSRLDMTSFIRVVSDKLSDYPLGYGPGLTGPSASMSKNEMVGNKFINDDLTWTYDNLIVSLVIDFGIGAIFYLLIILYIPIYFFRFLSSYYIDKRYEPYRILLVCFCATLVIIIGNWGAIGLTYNPESFAFWFFAALGFSTITKYKSEPSL